jgi:pyrroline-5-carboxylate reductase
MTRIGIVGCGTMGRTIATGLIRTGVLDPSALRLADRRVDIAEELAHDLAVPTAARPDAAATAADADVVVLCVKPVDVASVLGSMVERGALEHRPLLISIAAGVRTAAISSIVGASVPVVRAMPNTPCRIGAGMTVIGSDGTPDNVAIARRVFGPLGRCLALEEKHFDAVTAVSASGPAFLYVVIEALADGGVQCGLPRVVATELAAQATIGAGRMVLESGLHPASLKDDVTTPAGCTIAGLLALEDARIRSALARAIETTAHVAGGLAAR